MAEASDNCNEESRTLPELYKSIVEITDELDTTEESTASDAIQVLISFCLVVQSPEGNRPPI